MKTLFCLQRTSSLCILTRPSPCKPPTRTTPPRRTWKIHAKAKGFSGTPNNNNIQEKHRSMKKETVPERSSQKKDADVADDKIPQVVLDRMIVRILVYVGVPLVTGILILRGFDVAKEQNVVDFPKWLPFLTTLITFGASALGIAMGTLSASWDAEREGSLLGLEEAQRNWVEMWKDDESNNS